jgi:hypothetical protein
MGYRGGPGGRSGVPWKRKIARGTPPNRLKVHWSAWPSLWLSLVRQALRQISWGESQRFQGNVQGTLAQRRNRVGSQKEGKEANETKKRPLRL